MGARPCLIINSVDYITYVEMSGIVWSCDDLDSDESGRTLDGLMHRYRVAQKRKVTINLKPMKTEDFAALSIAIAAEYVTATILDPKIGAQTTFTFYNSSISSATIFDDGVDCWWSGGTFSLIEQ